MSSQRSQGPFLSLGFKKQFQCYLHCLALLNTLLSSPLRKQSYSATTFQLKLVNLFTKLVSDCFYPIISRRRELSSGSQLKDERLFFFILSHLNIQLLAVTPGMSCAMLRHSYNDNSFSILVTSCLSQYLEITQTSTLTSSSLQFFLIFLFLTILSILELTNRTIVSSLIQLPIIFLLLFICWQCCMVSLLIYVFLWSQRLLIKLINLSLASLSYLMQLVGCW